MTVVVLSDDGVVLVAVGVSVGVAVLVLVGPGTEVLVGAGVFVGTPPTGSITMIGVLVGVGVDVGVGLSSSRSSPPGFELDKGFLDTARDRALPYRRGSSCSIAVKALEALPMAPPPMGSLKPSNPPIISPRGTLPRPPMPPIAPPSPLMIGMSWGPVVGGFSVPKPYVKLSRSASDPAADVKP
jgi:hypothetical protein